MFDIGCWVFDAKYPKLIEAKYLFFLQIEFNSLCERQTVGIINGIGLTSHVIFPNVGARLSTAAGFFFATKSATNLCSRSTDVHIGNSTIRPILGKE